MEVIWVFIAEVAADLWILSYLSHCFHYNFRFGRWSY